MDIFDYANIYKIDINISYNCISQLIQ